MGVPGMAPEQADEEEDHKKTLGSPGSSPALLRAKAPAVAKPTSLLTAKTDGKPALLAMKTRAQAKEDELKYIRDRMLEDPDSNEPFVEPPKDLLEPQAAIDALSTPPDERETAHIDGIVSALGLSAPEFVHSLTEEQQNDLARNCLYHHFKPGTTLCDKDEEAACFFIVLRGSVTIEEPQVSHQEASKGVGGSQTRMTDMRVGKSFHHFPLVMQYRLYGYTATCGEEGASVLIILKSDYVYILRRMMEKEMTETVTMLKATPFFASWSDQSIARLNYWFDRRKYAPETDIVSQGDEANFCFIIRSGRCDVLVKEEERREGEVSPPKKKNPFALMRKAGLATLKAIETGQSTVVRANMRHIVTLRPGAIVGEIALFKDGVKRMATVRSSDNVELLILSKKDFLDLDRGTLHLISENARYNAACTKEPHQRTREDLQILQQRTSHLHHLSSLTSHTHLELCRVMRYRKVNESSMLVRKGIAASCLYVIISGKCNTFAHEPRRRMTSLAMSAFTEKSSNSDLRRRQQGIDAFAGLKPTSVLRAGDAIGEEELLLENPIWLVTAITTEPMELMEIDRADFDRILKADRTSERGRLIDFLGSLSMTDGISVAAIHGLSNSAQKRTFMRGQMCLAHPPEPSLTSSSFSYDYVYLIFSGEARLVAGANPEMHATKPPPISVPSSEYGPLVDAVPPAAHAVRAHLGASSLPVATLGPGECISDNLFKEAGARWCLEPITQLELLVIPRKEFFDTLRAESLRGMKELGQLKSTFFHQHFEHMVQQTRAMHENAHRKHRKTLEDTIPSPRKLLATTGLLPPTPRPRNAYVPIDGPRSSAARLPPLDATQLGEGGSLDDRMKGMPGMQGSPKIHLHRSSSVGRKPMSVG